LQQVVSDFRKERARLETTDSTTNTEGEPLTDSGNEVVEQPVKKRRMNGGKAQAKERSAAGIKKALGGRAGKTARGGKRKQQSQKRKASPTSEEEDPYVVPEQADLPPPLAVNLRPRPKPAYRGSKASADIEENEDDA